MKRRLRITFTYDGDEDDDPYETAISFLAEGMGLGHMTDKIKDECDVEAEWA